MWNVIPLVSISVNIADPYPVPSFHILYIVVEVPILAVDRLKRGIGELPADMYEAIHAAVVGSADVPF